MSEDLSSQNKLAIQAAKKHMNHVAWPTVLLVLGVLAGLAFTLYLFVVELLPTLGAVLLVGAFTYMSYTPLHEAVHGNIHGGRDDLKWLNDLCGYLVATIIALPYASHKVEHFAHHRFTNQPDRDPDYVVSHMANGLFATLVTVIRFLWVQNSFFGFKHWANASRRERMIYLAEILLSLGWRLGFVVVMFQPGIIAVVYGGYLLGGFFTAYWFAYRPHIPYRNPKRYQNTNSLIMPSWMKPVEWFWLGQNLHSVHHLFPRVPFYRYHKLHREIEPIMRAQGTPIIGIFSRQPVGN